MAVLAATTELRGEWVRVKREWSFSLGPSVIVTSSKEIDSSVNPMSPFTDPNDRFPSPFIYLKPDKGTSFGWSLPLWAIMVSTPWANTPPVDLSLVLFYFTLIKIYTRNTCIAEPREARGGAHKRWEDRREKWSKSCNWGGRV